ncbi:MAG: hypothetical protein FWD82_10930 [Defluviitaleaceae bacterium]|nr:hypothetical protein [Defluviitaleaceae bacterium]
MKVFKYILFLLLFSITLSACSLRGSEEGTSLVRAGNEVFGFLDVPEHFRRFEVFGESIHFTSDDGENTISILYIGNILEEHRAASMGDIIINSFDTILELGPILTEPHEILLAGYEAMGFYAIFADGTGAVVWTFLDDNNMLRQISIFAPLESEAAKNIFELMTLVETSYNFEN